MTLQIFFETLTALATVSFITKDLATRLNYRSRSVLEAKNFAFVNKVACQGAKHLKGINATMTPNQRRIDISFQAMNLPPRQFKALLLHELAHLKTRCEFQADELPYARGFGEDLIELLEAALAMNADDEFLFQRMLRMRKLCGTPRPQPKPVHLLLPLASRQNYW